MVIAVIAMGMVQGSLIEIILMISMGNERVSAALMSARTRDRSARHGIVGIHFKHMLIVMPLVRRMEVTIVQVIDMTIMGKRRMPTMLSMHMGVLLVCCMAHNNVPFKNMLFLVHSIAQKTREINY